MPSKEALRKSRAKTTMTQVIFLETGVRRFGKGHSRHLVEGYGKNRLCEDI